MLRPFTSAGILVLVERVAAPRRDPCGAAKGTVGHVADGKESAEAVVVDPMRRAPPYPVAGGMFLLMSTSLAGC